MYRIKYSIRICVLCYLSGTLGWLAVVTGVMLAVPEKINYIELKQNKNLVIRLCTLVHENHND